MSVRPLRGKLLVRRATPIGKTKGGIILPDQSKEKPERGTVLRIGPCELLENGMERPFDVKEGDTILFKRWAGEEIDVDDEKLYIMRHSDIYAVI